METEQLLQYFRLWTTQNPIECYGIGRLDSGKRYLAVIDRIQYDYVDGRFKFYYKMRADNGDKYHLGSHNEAVMLLRRTILTWMMPIFFSSKENIPRFEIIVDAKP
jgi:hypothetical protein